MCLTYVTEQKCLQYCTYNSHRHYAKWAYIHSHLPICTKIQPTTTVTSHIIAKYVPETNMPLKCHIYAISQLVHVQMSDICVSINFISTHHNQKYHPNTGIYLFYINGICP